MRLRPASVTVTVSDSAGGELNAYLPGSSTLTVNTGDRLLLQSWSEGTTHHCRLWRTSTGQLLQQTKLEPFLLQPTTVSAAVGPACGAGKCLLPGDVCLPSACSGQPCCEVALALTDPGAIELRASGARVTFERVRVFYQP